MNSPPSPRVAPPLYGQGKAGTSFPPAGGPARPVSLVAALVLVAPIFGPATQPDQRPGGPAFVLSTGADFASQDRDFTNDDVLHMWVPDPASRTRTLGGGPAPEPVAWWLLMSSTQLYQGSLTPVEGGLLGEFPLS